MGERERESFPGIPGEDTRERIQTHTQTKFVLGARPGWSLVVRQRQGATIETAGRMTFFVASEGERERPIHRFRPIGGFGRFDPKLRGFQGNLVVCARAPSEAKREKGSERERRSAPVINHQAASD